MKNKKLRVQGGQVASGGDGWTLASLRESRHWEETRTLEIFGKMVALTALMPIIKFIINITAERD